MPELVRASAESYPAREAVVDGDVRLDFAALAGEIDRFARALAGQGVGPGDRVAVWAPNSWRWVVAALGAVSAGAVLVPMNTRYKGPEAGYVLGRARVRALVTEDGFLNTGYVGLLDGEELPVLSTVVCIGPVPESAHRPVLGWDGFLDGPPGPLPGGVDAGDVSDIIFTSGTTGQPKGAMLTHRQTLGMYTAWSELAGLCEGDRYLVLNPFSHTFGYKAGILACLLRGATILPQPVFDVDAALALVQRERVTVLPGPPTLYSSILDHPRRAEYDLSSLRVAVTGATTVPVVLIERMHQELALERVLTAYGLTESCGMVTMCRPGDDAVTVATTSGRAVDGVEVRIAGSDGGSLLAGEPGEVLVRGYNVMRGYFEDEAATREAVDADGWLHTGDVGVLDERGNLRITDRIKDMYIVGGLNAYPAEIEQVLARHPAVAEVAVIGVPDGRLGEVGRAFVVVRPGAETDEDELIAFCRERMANYKVPRSVVLLGALPRNAVGKVVKPVLRGRA
ncbi:MAG TPA: FadD3 family acyl-CoA ligase [Rugosimonospora sp.]|nr:FadD3 family acyl-CoA ligase [Rugosimonospora sp.]